MKTLLITLLLCAGIGWSQTIDANPRGLVARTFAALGTPANGTIVYCSDCTATNPVAGSGTGTTARRENGAWNGGGGTGGLTSFTSPGVSVNIGGTLTAPTVDVNTALIQSLAQGQTASPNDCSASFSAGTLSCTMLPSPGAFVDSNMYPLKLRIISSNASTAGATVTIAGLGAKAILRPNGSTAIQASDILAGVPATAEYNPAAAGGGGAFVLSSVVGPGGPVTLTDGATVAWDTSSEAVRLATLTFTVHSGSRTLNLTNLISGGQYILKLIQDGTGGEGLTLGTGCTWQVLNNAVPATTVTLSAVGNGVNVLAFYYDGTNCVANFH